MSPALPALVLDEAMAIVAGSPPPGAWTPASGAARKAASRLADLFSEDELLEGLRLLQAPTSDAASGEARVRAVLAIELGIVLARTNLRAVGDGGSTLRLSS